ALAFAGRRARTLPHRDLIAAGLGVASIALTYVLVRAVMRWRERLGRGHVPGTTASLVAVALGAAAVGLYLVDQRVLLRLYGFFHVTLAILAFLLFALAVGTAYLVLAARNSQWRRLADPSFAAMLLFASAAGGAAALAALARADALRPVAFDRTAVLGKT